MDFCSRAVSFCLIVALAECPFLPVQAQTSKDAPSPDDSLRIYAVNFVKTRYFFRRWTGVGIYLGHGAVITAAHVVGRWPSLTNPRVLIAGQEIPVTVIRKGFVQRTDLALLSFDESRLPVSLRLRLNPVCKEPPRVGAEVVVAAPEGTVRSRIISPRLIVPEYRTRYATIIRNVPQASSGSGVFRASTRCLLGIISRKIQIQGRRSQNQHITRDEFAKYFVPAATIAKFLPPEFRF